MFFYYKITHLFTFLLHCVIILIGVRFFKKGQIIMKFTKLLRTAAIMAACVMSLGLFAACGDTDDASSTSSTKKAVAKPADTDKSFVITMYADKAPLTCENFESLIKDGFYDGLTFHRIVDGFMAQGGDPNGDGTGGSEKNIKGEFSSNGVENDLSHTRGIVSMARSQDPDSASSQFFICFSDQYASTLDGNYAAFGEVTEGMEVIDDLQNVERSLGGDNAISKPVQPVTIVKAEMIDDDENGNHRARFYINYTTDKKEISEDDYDKQTGEFTVALYKDKAPVTCENFEKLVGEGFYDGLTFHRIIENFVVQGGDPNGDGTGGSGESIKGEFSSNGVENDLSHTRGVISMARASDPDSASSQFFICLSDDYSSILDGDYAAFGMVTEGMDVVDAMSLIEKTVGTDQSESQPLLPVTIEKAEVTDPDADGNTQVKFTVSYFTAKQ